MRGTSARCEHNGPCQTETCVLGLSWWPPARLPAADTSLSLLPAPRRSQAAHGRCLAPIYSTPNLITLLNRPASGLDGRDEIFGKFDQLIELPVEPLWLCLWELSNRSMCKISGMPSTVVSNRKHLHDVQYAVNGGFAMRGCIIGCTAWNYVRIGSR